MPVEAAQPQNQQAGLKIDHMTLQLSGLTENDGKRLAILVSDGLAAAGLDDWTRVETINIRVDAGRGVGMERLSRQIVAEIVRQIRQTAG